MKRFMERFSENVARYGDRNAVVCGSREMTYRQVDLESAKIYAYLKKIGIGQEQFVMILMPKDVDFVPCVIGVWKAGAAFVLVEEGYARERVDYIYRDTGCILTLDPALYRTIMDTEEPLAGHEKTDLHDAAYAVCTSGSTGNPKAVLHEYGNIDRCAMTVPEQEDYPELQYGAVPPLGFVAAIISVISRFSAASTIHLISAEMLRNLPAITAYIEDRKLERIYLPPSFIRVYKSPPPTLKAVDTGSEPANGIFYEGGMPKIINTYGMTEAGFKVLTMELDQAYDVAPVGKPALDLGFALIDDDGNTVEGPGQGELCFRNEYVRGYINLPEQTAKAFQNGIYHTGDICRRDENGLYYVVGRTDDMIKINGNRIEPAEIEASVKKITGLSGVAAKGFSEEGRSFIVLYYLEKEAEGLGILRDGELKIDTARLREILPSYMIPTYYTALDQFPINPNGKLSRKDLKPPKAERDLSDYVAPANETERYFCDLMGSVLKIDPYGAQEDFFLAGGDSMRAMKLVASCDRFDLGSKDLYLYKTPQALAAYFLSHKEVSDEDDDALLKRDFRLLDGQCHNLYFQAYVPNSNFRNIHYLIRLKADVDPERLAKAADRVVREHPPLLTKLLRDGDGNYMQRYEERFYQPVRVQNVTFEEFEEAKKEFSAVFKIEDQPLYRIGVWQTPSDAWFGLVIHHAIADGTSFGILLGDLFRLYQDENYEIPKDRYFAILAKNEEDRRKEGYREAQRVFRRLVGEKLRSGACPIGLRPDHVTDSKEAALLIKWDLFPRKEGRGGDFFLAACAIAEAWFNKSESALVISVYSTRDDKNRMSAAGFLLSTITVCISVSEDASAPDLLKTVREQVSFGIAHSEYSFVEDMIGDPTPMLRFNYEKDILRPSPMAALAEEKIRVPEDNIMTGSVSVNIVDNEGEDTLHLGIRYAKDAYDEESMEEYAALFQKAVAFLEEDK